MIVVESRNEPRTNTSTGIKDFRYMHFANRSFMTYLITLDHDSLFCLILDILC